MARKVALWLVGEPGVGKTHLVRALMPKNPWLVQSPKWTVAEDWALAGHYTGDKFDGADRVPYSGARAALELWERDLAGVCNTTVFDGDRFSNTNCVDFVRRSAGDWRCVCVLIEDQQGAEARRQSRGSAQNPSWVTGRRTKSARFFDSFTPKDKLLCRGAGIETDWSSGVRAFLEAMRST